MSAAPHDGPEMVDWDFAVQTAQRFVRPGPEISRAQADEVVAELRREVGGLAVQLASRIAR